MPLSADNPQRNRNFVILILAGTFVFTLIMAGFIALTMVGRDTDAYVRFLTLLVVTLVPSVLGAWQAFRAHAVSKAIHADVRNGVLKDKVKEGVAEVLNGDTASVTYTETVGPGPSTQDTGREKDA